MKQLIKIGLCAALCASWVGTVHADAEAAVGYANAHGQYVSTGHDGCLITPRWSPEQAVEDYENGAPEFVEACHPELVPEEVVPMAPMMVQERATFATDAFFAFDSDALKPEATAKLEQLVRDMSTAQTINTIEVVGHTDSTGPADYNQGLSERRANSVRDELVNLGINPALIQARGEGENMPRASNSTREGRAENRRVDVNVEGIVEEVEEVVVEEVVVEEVTTN
jgi:outer membrane protein OmpA-like peptidoglycan-associated protein